MNENDEMKISNHFFYLFYFDDFPEVAVEVPAAVGVVDVRLDLREQHHHVVLGCQRDEASLPNVAVSYPLPSL